MKLSPWTAIAGLLLLGCVPSRAFELSQGAQEHAPTPGLYEIEVVTQTAAGAVRETRVVKRCFTARAVVAHSVFEILTDAPVASCPRYEICTGGPRVGLQTLCDATTTASAIGMFALDDGGFRGRIDIDRELGDAGLVELQYGRRIGECPSD